MTGRPNSLDNLTFAQVLLVVQCKFNIDTVKFSFTWMIKADQESTEIITLDGQSICMNSLWYHGDRAHFAQEKKLGPSNSKKTTLCRLVALFFKPLFWDPLDKPTLSPSLLLYILYRSLQVSNTNDVQNNIQDKMCSQPLQTVGKSFNFKFN